MDESFNLAEKVILIHPARFLFRAGSTPNSWNDKMLSDKHFTILEYWADSDVVFPNLSTPIKGGVVVSCHDINKIYGAIEAFTQFNEMNSILRKVTLSKGYESILSIVYFRTSYRFTRKLHEKYPNAITKLSEGHAFDISSNIFTRITEVFYAECPDADGDYAMIIGRDENNRITRFIEREYINDVENFDSYKLFIPQAGGSGAFGEIIGRPIIGKPHMGATETFISIGNFESEEQAVALEKYVKSKFARALLSVLKVTQNGNKPVWKYIPLQDFTSSSDIDWSKPVHEIDLQLYKKYGLSDEETAFIESHVKEMA